MKGRIKIQIKTFIDQPPRKSGAQYYWKVSGACCHLLITSINKCVTQYSSWTTILTRSKNLYAQYKHILTNPTFVAQYLICVFRQYWSTQQSSLWPNISFCHNYSAQQKILWLNNILYHIFINSTEIICDWNMYKCTSLPICSIEMQLYGSVGLGQFIVHGYFR